ncbi:type IV pilus twitching motility protein PilT [uncultured Acetatifactor sp.]|uniref:type IV pilus twitching motility protein PilT n=1 Tax=uncultured Acetatifactor sp. TaxID=1671927 RepID=UPI002606048B|nr:PilT/PilU family type 4a pilus ATPase [uncultured Acetatifactor sp.]
MKLQEILELAVRDEDVADIFLVAGLPVAMKRNGVQTRMDMAPLMPKDIGELVEEIYAEAKRTKVRLEAGEDDDFSLSMSRRENFPGGRFRVNVFRQRGSLAAVIRVSRFELPDPRKLGIPEDILALTDDSQGRNNKNGGLVLVTGAAGTGKTTTLACMIDRINNSRDCHIITMEDPIEYIHRHKKAIVTQREISIDTPGYLSALRSALRESPDVILLGEMRDYDTISAALIAAETGVLVFSTLHTNSAADTINRIVDVFPEKEQARTQLAQVLKAVVCQQLVPSTMEDGEGNQIRIPVFEVMKSTDAIQNMIRENKVNQLGAVMQAGVNEGMCTMDGNLLRLCREGRITKSTALKFRTHYGYEYMEKRLGEN